MRERTNGVSLNFGPDVNDIEAKIMTAMSYALSEIEGLIKSFSNGEKICLDKFNSLSNEISRCISNLIRDFDESAAYKIVSVFMSYVLDILKKYDYHYYNDKIFIELIARLSQTIRDTDCLPISPTSLSTEIGKLHEKFRNALATNSEVNS